MIQVEKQIVIFSTVGHLLTVQPRDLGRQFGLIQRRLRSKSYVNSSPSHVRVGSKSEELNVSKSNPLSPIERTSMRRAATSLMGQ